MLMNVLMGVQIFLGLFMILVVMPQESKTHSQPIQFEETAQAYFKPKGKEAFLNKVTKVLGVLFFINALALLVVSKGI